MNGQMYAADPIAVMLVDGHEPTRKAITAQLSAQPDFEVSAALSTADEAIEHVTLLAPDVAVIDVRLPDCNGPELCERIHHLRPSTKCILHANTTSLKTGTTPWVAAVVLKQLTGDQLAQTIRKIFHS